MFVHKVESDKGQLEIVYDVQWKTPGNDDDKAKIIGIVDTADTYLDWNTFKSYLIQNSGNMRFTTDDIRISYLDSDDDLIPVDSESEFRECLKFSRKRARRGRKIMMKVSLVSNCGAKPKNLVKLHGESAKNPKLFCLKKKDISGTVKQETAPPPELDKTEIPEWFEAYMTKFKAELVEEITNVVRSCQNNNSRASRNSEAPKEQHQYYPLQNMIEKRKKKKKMPEEDSSDCTDGLQLQWEERLELLRHMQKINKREKKFEKKLDAKLEKLESKTKKIMEKKHNLWGSKKSSTGVPLPSHVLAASQSAEPTGSATTSAPTNCDHFVANQCMDAVPVDEYNFVPHVLRGEMVHQIWKVVNSGQKQWTDETELRFAWGSKSLVPLTTVVKCPLLKPAETGKVKVTLQAPLFPGHFESYWHFHHQGRRFGHWLGCAVIVDPEPRPPSPLQIQSIIPATEAIPSLPVDLTMKCQQQQQPQPQQQQQSYSDDMKIYNNIEIKPELITTTNEDEEEPKQNLIDANTETIEKIIDEEPKLQTDNLETAALHLQAFLSSGKQNNLTSSPPPAEKCVTETELEEFPRLESYTSLKPDYLTFIFDQQNGGEAEKTDSLERNLDTTTDKYENILTSVGNISLNDDDHNKMADAETDYLFGSDSDNISIISGTISVDTDDSEPSDEFVVVPMPTCVNCDEKLPPPPSPQPQEPEQQSTPSPPPPPPEESDNNNNNNNMEAPLLDAADQNTVFVRDESGVAIPVAKVVSTQIAHPTFGDPNFGHGPNGPRFPFTQEMLHPSAPVCHNPIGPCNFRPKHGSPTQPFFRQKRSNPLQSQRTIFTAQEPMIYPFDEMYQAQEMASADADKINMWKYEGTQGKANEAWPNANIHTEQPRACKFQYAYTNSSKDTLSNSSGSVSGTRSTSGSRRTSSDTREQSPVAAAVQILPETLVTGAVNVASSAINTARSVIDMLRPRHDEPLVAQWEPINPPMEASLRQLSEMGFNNRELNIMLLKQHKNDVARVISELVQ